MPTRLRLEGARLSDQFESLVFFFPSDVKAAVSYSTTGSRRNCEEGTGDVHADARFENDNSSEYQIRGTWSLRTVENEWSFTFPGQERAISFDRATVRLETLSTFDFGPKKGFCLAHFGPNLPSPPAPTLLGFYWAKSLAPAPRRFTAWSLAIFNKSDAVQTSLFLLKRTRSIKSLATLCTHNPTRFLQHAVPPP